jgi:hypothetical protein
MMSYNWGLLKHKDLHYFFCNKLKNRKNSYTHGTIDKLTITKTKKIKKQKTNKNKTQQNA